MHLQVQTLLEDFEMLSERGSFNTLKADSQNIAALMCLTEEMGVTQNLKEILAKGVYLVSCTMEIYITVAWTICLIHSNTVITGMAVVIYYQTLQNVHRLLYN